MKHALFVLVVINGCGILGPSQPTLSSSAVYQGLRFELVSLPPTPDEPGSRFGLSGTNVSGQRLVREMGTGCTLWPRVYRTNDLSRPAWDSMRLSPNCAGRGLMIDLQPGQSIAADVWAFRFVLDDSVLGDSLLGGDFFPGVLLRPTGEVSPSFELALGDPIRLHR